MHFPLPLLSVLWSQRKRKPYRMVVVSTFVVVAVCLSGSIVGRINEVGRL